MIKTKQKGSGRPSLKPTFEQRKYVELLTGLGLRQEEICLLVINPDTGKSISERTLREKFAKEIEVGAIKANASVSQSLYKNATTGNVAAQIWWTKCRMGWKDTTGLEVTGHNKGPVKVVSANLTIQDLASLYARTVADPDALLEYADEQELPRLLLKAPVDG